MNSFFISRICMQFVNINYFLSPFPLNQELCSDKLSYEYVFPQKEMTRLSKNLITKLQWAVALKEFQFEKLS